MVEGQHFVELDQEVERRDDWSRRRRKNIPTNKRLLVVACMDERIPVEEALNLEVGDAHIFRNAGGKVTDDVIRSAALSTNFFGTEEVIILNHTDCGMMSAGADDIVEGLNEATDHPPDQVPLNPALESLSLEDGTLEDWLFMTEDIDEACSRQVHLLEEHPWIPDSTTIHGYIYEVESDSLRTPGDRISQEISVAVSE